jgi:hypothetical protein
MTSFPTAAKALAVPQLKHCTSCDELKPRSAFFPCRQSSDGLTAICRECVFARARRDRAARERRAALRVGGAP